MDRIFLSQVIKELVLENGGVVLPEFGVFGTEKVSAFFSDEGRKINPPTKKITFSLDLAADGDELPERISSKLDESPLEVKKQLDELIDALRNELRDGRRLVLEGFGTLEARYDGKIDFLPEGNRDFFAEMYAMEPIMLRFAEHEPVSEQESGSVVQPETVPEPVSGPVGELESKPALPKEKLEPAERQSRWFTALIVILSIVILVALLFILGRGGAFDTFLYSQEELELMERAGD